MNGASSLPAEIQGLKHTEVRKVFPEPTLVEIKGATDETVFLCTLLHGNEPASFGVLQKLQKHLETHTPRRSIMIFVGNVEAAEKNKRYLPHQKDYNRVWTEGDSTEHELMREVKRRAFEKKLFASVDVHNNTGTNPFYGCINKKRMDDLKLASLFSDQVVFFENPNNVQSMAFSEVCPSMTLECGKPDNPDGPEKAFQLLLDLLQIDGIPEHVADTTDLDVYETQGKIVMDTDNPAEFPKDYEFWNFKELEKGFELAQAPSESCIRVCDGFEKDISDDFIRYESGKVILTQSMVPAMLTTNMEVVKQDCLGYLMTKLDWTSFR